jgi:hypothetical protein
MKKIKSINNYTIKFDEDAYNCLPKFELNNVRTLLVLKNNTVVGTVTDGDIRKALINNRLMLIPVMHIMKNDYLFGLNEAECEIVLKKYPYVFMVPLVKENKELVQIYVRDI